MVKSRVRLVVVVGGPSEEHDVSLASGAEVIRHLDREQWDPFVVRIDQNGRWCFPANTDVRGLAEPLPLADGLNTLKSLNPTIVFPVMHGPYGEDGRFQALLELLDLPYVGSGVETSAVAMNKAFTRDILAGAGLPVPPAEVLHRGKHPTVDAPCVVKPLRLGSSVGMSVVHTNDELALALERAFQHDNLVLNEQFVAGTELTAGVLETEDGTPEALPLIEIRPKAARFFDYHAKYTPGATDEICPAPVSDAIRERVQAIGIQAHRLLGCRCMSRTDVIVDASGEPWVLEINTIPGLTATSLLPQAAAEAGIDFTSLIDRLLTRALAD
jgi:D-alanine-D-alanine ligase